MESAASPGEKYHSQGWVSCCEMPQKIEATDCWFTVTGS